VGSVVTSLSPEAFRRINLSAILGFFTSIRRRDLLYLSRRRLRVCRMRRRVAFRRPLKQIRRAY
jgi:hypothetical protein